MRDVILGTAENYSAKDLAPFIASIRETGFQGNVVLFTCNISDETEKYLRANEIEIVHYERYQGKNANTLRRIAARGFGAYYSLFRTLKYSGYEKLVPWLWDINSGRYLRYREYLRKQDCDRILISDVSDLYFQSDPFVYKWESRIYSFEEFTSKSLGSSRHNSKWIKQAFGSKLLSSLGGKPILCSGVIMGSRYDILEYLELLCNLISTRTGSVGYDQGIHNVLAYEKMSGRFLIYPYGVGLAMHIGIVPSERLVFDSNMRVLLNNGQICPIIHQYDRHEYLEKFIYTKYKN